MLVFPTARHLGGNIPPNETNKEIFGANIALMRKMENNPEPRKCQFVGNKIDIIRSG